MDPLRKLWLCRADEYIRVINEKENYLALLKRDNASKYRLNAVEAEIETLVKFYNQTESILEAHEMQRLTLKIKNVLLGNEIRKLITMLTQIREFAVDPEALMLLISEVHDQVVQITQDGAVAPPNKHFQMVVDTVLELITKENKDV